MITGEKKTQNYKLGKILLTVMAGLLILGAAVILIAIFTKKQSDLSIWMKVRLPLLWQETGWIRAGVIWDFCLCMLRFHPIASCAIVLLSLGGFETLYQLYIKGKKAGRQIGILLMSLNFLFLCYLVAYSCFILYSGQFETYDTVLLVLQSIRVISWGTVTFLPRQKSKKS